MKPTISPSTLSNWLDVDDPDLIAQLLEPDASKSLCQDVCLLLTSPDELHDHRAFLDAVTYEVIAEIDVLAAVVKHWVLAEGNHRLVIDEDECGAVSWFNISPRRRASQMP